MSANTTARIITRVSRRSSTGNAPVQPARYPSAPVTFTASPKPVSNAYSTPTSESGDLNQPIPAPHRRPSNRYFVAESP
jgi:hypothetical protein